MRKIISLMLAVAAPALAHAQTPHDRLTQVIDDHWKWYLSVHPVEATAPGVREARTGWLTTCKSPSLGWRTAADIPRWRTCGSAKT